MSYLFEIVGFKYKVNGAYTSLYLCKCGVYKRIRVSLVVGGRIKSCGCRGLFMPTKGYVKWALWESFYSV